MGILVKRIDKLVAIQESSFLKSAKQETRTFIKINNKLYPLADGVNWMGKSGWELISTDAFTDHAYVYIFKRPIETRER